jgi:hypothetical protein
MIQHDRKSISYEVKKKRGNGIPLANSPFILKIWTNFPINRDGSLAPGDQLHQTMNHPRFKAFSNQDIPQKGLANPIIRFLKIELQDHRSGFPDFQLVDNFM